MALAEDPQASDSLPGIERRQRSDAVRNRARLLEAAADCFRESGLDVGVTEIAARAGVGRATLFRNFPTKSDLIIAIVDERMRDAIEHGRALLASGQPHGELTATAMADIAGRQQLDRALFEGIGAEEFLENPDIRAAHHEMLGVLDQLIAKDVEAGTIRGDISALDVLMLIKGACAVAVELSGAEGQRALQRQLGLVRSALSASAGASCPLEGTGLTLEEFERAHRCGG